jgi:hypothetical protein
MQLFSFFTAQIIFFLLINLHLITHLLLCSEVERKSLHTVKCKNSLREMQKLNFTTAEHSFNQ